MISMMHKHWRASITVCCCCFAIIGFTSQQIIKFKNNDHRTAFNLSYYINEEDEEMVKPEDDDITSSSSTTTSRQLQSPIVYGNLNCELEMSMYSNFNRAGGNPQSFFYQLAMESMQISTAFRSAERVMSAVITSRLRNRKIVFLGDSLTRHLFVSFGCLSGSIVDSRIPWKRFPAPHPSDRSTGRHSGYHIARAVLSGGTDMMYYHLPHLMLNRESYSIPMLDNSSGGRYSWLNSCQRSEPFRVQIPNELSLSSNDDYGEISLTDNDVVVINGSVHPDRRDSIVNNYLVVLGCMNEARQSGGGRAAHHPSWPTFIYMVTPQPHEISTLSPYRNGCLDRDKPSAFENEDKRLFPSLVNTMLANGIDWSRMARYHVGYGDCIHYTQMGLHDVIAAELADTVGRMRLTTTPPVGETTPKKPIPLRQTTRSPKARASGGRSSNNPCKGASNEICEKLNQCELCSGKCKSKDKACNSEGVTPKTTKNSCKGTTKYKCKKMNHCQFCNGKCLRKDSRKNCSTNNIKNRATAPKPSRGGRCIGTTKDECKKITRCKFCNGKCKSKDKQC